MNKLYSYSKDLNKFYMFLYEYDKETHKVTVRDPWGIKDKGTYKFIPSRVIMVYDEDTKTYSYNFSNNTHNYYSNIYDCIEETTMKAGLEVLRDMQTSADAVKLGTDTLKEEISALLRLEEDFNNG